MIENDEQLRATYEALGDLYSALASLRKRLLPINPRQYALFAEGPLDEISKLQSEIAAYLGIADKDTKARTADTLSETPPPYGSTNP